MVNIGDNATSIVIKKKIITNGARNLSIRRNEYAIFNDATDNLSIWIWNKHLKYMIYQWKFFSIDIDDITRTNYNVKILEKILTLKFLMFRRVSPLKIPRARSQRPRRKPRRKSNHQASSEARSPPAGARRVSPPRGGPWIGCSVPRLLHSTHTRLIIIIQKMKRCCAYPRYIIR